MTAHQQWVNRAAWAGFSILSCVILTTGWLHRHRSRHAEVYQAANVVSQASIFDTDSIASEAAAAEWAETEAAQLESKDAELMAAVVEVVDAAFAKWIETEAADLESTDSEAIAANAAVAPSAVANTINPAVRWLLEGPTRTTMLEPAPVNKAPAPEVFGTDVPEVIAQAIARSGLDPLKDTMFATTANGGTNQPSGSACPPQELLEALRRQHQQHSSGGSLVAPTTTAAHETTPIDSKSSVTPASHQANQANENDDPIVALRSAERQLERTAEELEAHKAYEQADAVRRLAEQIRLDARRNDQLARDPAKRWY